MDRGEIRKMKTKTLALGAVKALVFGMFFIPAVSAYIPTVPYDAVEMPTNIETNRGHDGIFSPPDWTTDDVPGKERVSYTDRCIEIMEGFGR
jgi:hypothetical protein